MTEDEALEIARQTSIGQIKANVTLLNDPMKGCADHVKIGTDIISRQRIIEAGMLLLALSGEKKFEGR